MKIYMVEITKIMEEEVLNAIATYLVENEVTNLYDQEIDITDLFLTMDGSVVYLWSWKDVSYSDANTGHNTVHEITNEKYATLISKEELKNLIANAKKNN